jgi:hypothetical protein
LSYSNGILNTEEAKEDEADGGTVYSYREMQRDIE